MNVQPENLAFLRELESTAAACLERHLAVAKPWMPHEYVPWSMGRDFTTEPWDPSDSQLSPIARISLELNLLTEDNLPSYHRELSWATGFDSAWGTWANRWTAEEGRHSIAIRDFLLVTRGVDPDELERGRMHMLGTAWYGISGQQKNVLRLLAYTSIQELATRISHRNAGRCSESPLAERLLSRIASDENLHMVFYRDVLSAAFELAPSDATRAVASEVIGFMMPGFGIIDFEAKAKAMAKAGIYDLRIHRDEVLLPLLRHWQFFERSGLDGEAERARAEIAAFLAALDAEARKYEDKRAAAAAAAAASL